MSCSQTISRTPLYSLVPRPSPHVRDRGSGDFSCYMAIWGGVAPRSESLNQIAEHVIIVARYFTTVLLEVDACS